MTAVSPAFQAALDAWQVESLSRHDEAQLHICPPALGSFLFSDKPANASTISINGTAVEFRTSPAAGKVTIADTLAHTLANLLLFLNDSTDEQLVKMRYSIDTTHLFMRAKAPGAEGNNYSLDASSNPASNATRSGETFDDGSTVARPWAAAIGGALKKYVDYAED